MEAKDQISLSREFVESKYYAELLDNISKGDSYLVIDFEELAKFSVELAQDILDSPSETLKAIEIGIKQIEAVGDHDMIVRIKNAPNDSKINIRELRSKHIGRFIILEGIVGQKSKALPHITSARFECPACGNCLSVLQLEEIFRTPNNCSCGRKGKFRLISKELIDAQTLILEEDPKDLDGGDQPARVTVHLKRDLVNPLETRKCEAGSKVRITGILQDIPIIQQGQKLTKLDMVLEANHVKPLEEQFFDIDISPEDEKEIKELSKNPGLFDMMVDSITPMTFGHRKIKEALVLQLFGGIRKIQKKKNKRGTALRGDIHILLIGDPGTSKSQILKQIASLAPKSRYGAGKGVSGPGLTATVMKDEILKGWALKAGLLALANKGIACIDELDKISKEDKNALHEPMEQQQITINKATIQAILSAQTSILAAANPKLGRFDPYEILALQIDLPSTLLSRFDLIFVLRDLPDEEKDKRLMGFILDLHENDATTETPISEELFRKYIAYAKRKIRPKLSKEAKTLLEEFYVDMRNSNQTEGLQTIPISARQGEAVIRLTEASAKSRLSDIAYKSDAQKAIDLITYCLNKVGVDPKTGKVDMDSINLGQSSSSRNNLFRVKNMMRELEKTEGKIIHKDSLLKASGLTDDELEEALEKLRRAGEIFEPRRKEYQLLS